MKRLIIPVKASDGMTIHEAVFAANQLAGNSGCEVELTFNCTKTIVQSGVAWQTLERQVADANSPHPQIQYIEGELK